KELVNKLKIGERQENICKEMAQFCQKCHPSSPLMCIELCQIWKLKKNCQNSENRAKPEFIDILNNARKGSNLKMLGFLTDKSASLENLRNKLKEETSSTHPSSLLKENLTPLIDAGLIEKKTELYTITAKGEKIYNILTKSEIARLSLNFTTHDEAILVALSSAPKSSDDLVKLAPPEVLYESLKRLLQRQLVEKPTSPSHIVYFKTKRRPTRKLSPVETQIFKSLPKEGISVKDLSRKVGVKTTQLYRYLRRLRYKKHVKKEEKFLLYNITPAGRSLVQSLNIARNILS
ncbi:winged helix-turn-helix domain-containing protein, partial [Candidatus Bathyarchaeota archaeon]|nr:winged helix-turn-helix domain-containing protein [Candidatus Bathyarchaeota archaeon]